MINPFDQVDAFYGDFLRLSQSEADSARYTPEAAMTADPKPKNTNPSPIRRLSRHHPRRPHEAPFLFIVGFCLFVVLQVLAIGAAIVLVDDDDDNDNRRGVLVSVTAAAAYLLDGVLVFLGLFMDFQGALRRFIDETVREMRCCWAFLGGVEEEDMSESEPPERWWKEWFDVCCWIEVSVAVVLFWPLALWWLTLLWGFESVVCVGSGLVCGGEEVGVDSEKVADERTPLIAREDDGGVWVAPGRGYAVVYVASESDVDSDADL